MVQLTRVSTGSFVMISDFVYGCITFHLLLFCKFVESKKKGRVIFFSRKLRSQKNSTMQNETEKKTFQSLRVQFHITSVLLLNAMKTEF